MDPSSAAQSQPHLSRDEKRHLFEEQKQQRLERYVACMQEECVSTKPDTPSPPSPPCDSFSAGTPFSSSGRMGEDVEQIQDKVEAWN